MWSWVNRVSFSGFLLLSIFLRIFRRRISHLFLHGMTSNVLCNMTKPLTSHSLRELSPPLTIQPPPPYNCILHRPLCPFLPFNSLSPRLFPEPAFQPELRPLCTSPPTWIITTRPPTRDYAHHRPPTVFCPPHHPIRLPTWGYVSPPWNHEVMRTSLPPTE